MFLVRGIMLLSKFLRFPAPSVFFCTSSLGLKGLFTNPQQPLALKLWDTDITTPLLEHCPVQILTKRLHECKRQGTGEQWYVQLGSPQGLPVLLQLGPNKTH